MTLRYIALEKLVIPPNRQRQEHDIEAHQELIASISKLGLLHPPVLRVVGDEYVLVAGERRVRAMADMIALGEPIKHGGVTAFLGMIPYTYFGDLSALDAEEAELDENIKRKDLTWQERAVATSRLAALREKQASAAGMPAPSRIDLVVEVRGKANENDQNEVRLDLLLAKNLDRPEVAKAKNVREAFKALKNIERKERNEGLALSIGKTYSSASHTLRNEDSLYWMSQCPAGYYDVILTDPPYGMGADEFGDSGGRAAGGHGYADDVDVLYRIMETFPEESFRITKNQAHLYVFCDIDKFHYLSGEFALAGWNVFRTPLIWYKPNGQRAPWPENGPQRKYECILFAEKGKKKVTKIYGDVLEYPTEANLGHSAQKPVALYRDLLNRSVNPGDRVLDCFAGTGPILPAAHDLKCYATAIEKDTVSYGIAATRLKALV